MKIKIITHENLPEYYMQHVIQNETLFLSASAMIDDDRFWTTEKVADLEEDESCGMVEYFKEYFKNDAEAAGIDKGKSIFSKFNIIANVCMFRAAKKRNVEFGYVDFCSHMHNSIRFCGGGNEHIIS